MMTGQTICGVDLEAYVIQMEAFHGYRSPGMLLGGFMIEAALDRLGPTPCLNVATETVVCLPDAVQLLTPCTIGNGFLQLLDWGKFALTAYDRLHLDGVRAHLDLDRIATFPRIQEWFDRSSRTGEKPAFEVFAEEAMRAHTELIVCTNVQMHRALKESKPVSTGRCETCGESYALHLGPRCPTCSGAGYYGPSPPVS
jgi:formylmethanofuran dehydrogenase subunit E